MFIISYQIPATGSAYTSLLKGYVFSSSKWNEVTFPSTISSFTTLNDKAYPILTPSGDTVGIEYFSGIVGSPQKVVYIAKVNGTSLIPYTIPV